MRVTKQHQTALLAVAFVFGLGALQMMTMSRLSASASFTLNGNGGLVWIEEQSASSAAPTVKVPGFDQVFMIDELIPVIDLTIAGLHAAPSAEPMSWLTLVLGAFGY